MLSKEEQKTLDTYNKIAKGWAKKYLTNLDFWKPQFEKFQKFVPKGKILDIGCGHGRDALLFLKNGYEYVGIDISEGLLEEARKLAPEGTFRKMDMYSLDFPRKSFDGFWASASLLHIPKNKVHKVLREIRKVVKPRGVGFFAMKEGDGEKMIKVSDEDERFFIFYTQDEFSRLLENNGFEILESERSTKDYNPPDHLTIWLTYFVKVK